MTEVLNDKEKELKEKDEKLKEKDIKKVDIPDTEWVVVARLLIILGVTAAFMYLFYIGIHCCPVEIT
jgi:hypothetical protein